MKESRRVQQANALSRKTERWDRHMLLMEQHRLIAELCTLGVKVTGETR
jgi:hypothetical protein